jgi:UDP-N-acetylmuramoyl-tripeptide--D-alanyl-D-alanine ligase
MTPTMHLHASAIARATGGTLAGPDVVVSGATQDSRALRAGQLFVPIVAERDGHDFVADALAAGAPAYLSARGHLGGTAILVDDTSAALEQLGAVAREHLPSRVVGITGSVGKTSTKDLTAAVLATTFRTHASDRSFNNEIGVPLTLLEAPDDVEAIVVEMGARRVGHIAGLCRIARPTAGIVTRVGGAHLEMFGTLDQVALAKGELVESLPSSGTAVLNADDQRVAAMAERTTARVVTYGAQADVRAERVVVRDDLTTTFRLCTPWGELDVVLAARGRHNVDNALAACAAALALGVPIDAIAPALASVQLSSWRMDLQRTPGGARVLNDAYNANPVSMRAALDALAQLPATRRVAVLGAMAELGAGSEADHREVAAHAAAVGVAVVAVAAPAYGTGVLHVSDLDAASTALGDLGPDDAVLVKGSRVAGLERLAAWLTAPDGARPARPPAR